MRAALRGASFRGHVTGARYGRAVSPGPRMVVDVAQLPPPVGGWNARDALSAMELTDAIALDNWIADAGGIRTREGYAVHCTGLGGPVQSLMEYNAPSGSPTLFGAANATIWNVTTAGAAVSSLTGLTNNKFQHINFSVTAGTHYLFIANGADDVRTWDGAVWATPAITGVTLSTIVNVAVHLNRIWLIPDNSLDPWYLPTSSIAGAANKLILGPYCTKGGKLLAMASWTRDGGAGMDDLAVFITSKGQAVIFSGTNPASASTWEKVGTFDIPEPVGHRCLCKVGADLALITAVGVVPLSAILPLSIAGASKVAVTDKISGAVKAVYGAGSTFFGWQLIEYSKGNLLFLNVPVSDGVTYHQYVMNTQNGSWQRFLAMNAQCWGTKGDALYFGGLDGTVYKYGGVFTDNTAAINAVAILAYNNLGSSRNKMVREARPLLTVPTGYTPLVALRSDYDTGVVNYAAIVSTATGSLWDVAIWDVSPWGLSSQSSAKWQSVYAEGSVISPAIGVAVKRRVHFNGVDLMYETGDWL